MNIVLSESDRQWLLELLTGLLVDIGQEDDMQSISDHTRSVLKALMARNKV